MGLPYPIPAEELSIEKRVSNSRFIATATYADTVDKAKAFINHIRGMHSKAHHHVYAFVIGYGPSVIEGCSDDGEPSGTAGRPTLAVVRGSGLGDTVVVVTRYFGGTKLGTGGLVRAYSDATRTVLEKIARQEKAEKKLVQLTLPYSHYEALKRIVGETGGQVVGEEFAAEVTIEIELVADELEHFVCAASKATAGQVKVVSVR